ncbi:MAG TPA: hypothetical protein VER08_04920 [Pyrinomonadaceae bacterium]|nr:hypothetical protein [Pyrinomonadaceae bacterium]
MSKFTAAAGRLTLAFAGLFFASFAFAEARAQQPTPGRVVGEVTGVDAAAGRISVRAEGGEQFNVLTDERTAVLSLPPGSTDAARATRITLAGVAAGDRLFARGDTWADGRSLNARQVVVTKAAASASSGGREDWRARGLNGRVAALDARSKRLTVATRGREGPEQLTIDASGAGVRFLRFAPDSVDVRNAVPGSFADIRVGDQLRALGARSADGAGFTPEEIVTGSLVRLGGTVAAVNAARGELTLKAADTNQTFTVAVGQRTTLRRVTAEQAAEFAQRAERRGQRRGEGGREGGERLSDEERARRREERRAQREREGGARPGDGARQGGGQGGGRGGRSLQAMFESLPAVTLADLKAGDTVLITGTTGADASRLTAVSVLTGDADFLGRMMRGQGRAGRDDMSPGLPGDVVGGGTPPDRPQP